MTYQITISGHTDDADTSREEFKHAVRTLRPISPSFFSASYSDNIGSLSANDVPDEEVTTTETAPVEEDDVEEEEASPEDSEG